MKREINAKKRGAKPKLKKAVSASETQTKKAQAGKEKNKQIVKAAPKGGDKPKARKKPVLINLAEGAKKNSAPKKSNSSVKTIVSGAKKSVSGVKIKNPKTRNKPSAENRNAELKTLKQAVLNSKAISKTKIEKPKAKKAAKSGSVEKTEPKAKKTKSKVSFQKPKAAERKIEAVDVKPKSKPQKRFVKPIGSAVFRGKEDKYDFKVFPLDEKFENVQAVYIISKRKTDKQKRGHHALICIGATDALADEIRKHRKGKSLRQKQANAISILAETDAKKRLKIENDLKAAHSISCNHG